MLLSYILCGLKGICPKCSNSKMFISRFKMRNRCDSCNLQFFEDNGDNWFFLLIIDRALFIFPIIVAYYFDSGPMFIVILSLILLVLFIIFTPMRLGLSFAFVYFFRVRSEL